MANNNAVPKSRVPDIPASERGGYCGALQRAPPSMPAGLARRLANKDNFGMGKVNSLIENCYYIPSACIYTLGLPLIYLVTIFYFDEDQNKSY